MTKSNYQISKQMFQYPLWIKVLCWVLPIVLLFQVPLLIMYLLTFIINEQAFTATNILIELIFIFIGISIPVAIIFPYINMFNEIEINDDGFTVRVFRGFFSRKQIPWNEVLSITRASSKFIDLWAIRVNRLTIWHRLVGTQFGFGFQPVVIVQTHLNNRDDLIRLVENEIKQRENEPFVGTLKH